MNLGFDIDGVIAKTSDMLVNNINETFNSKLTIDIFKAHDFTENIYSEDEEINTAVIKLLKDLVVSEEKMKSIEIYPEAPIIINKLKKVGHKIYIITARHTHLKEMTATWLRNHGISFDGFAITNGITKSDYALKYKLDAFVDDLESNLYELHKSKKRWRKGLLLMTQPWNADTMTDTSKYIRVHGWNDVHRLMQMRNRLK